MFKALKTSAEGGQPVGRVSEIESGEAGSISYALRGSGAEPLAGGESTRGEAGEAFTLAI